MKIYKIVNGIVIQVKDKFYHIEKVDWDEFINDDNLYEKLKQYEKTQEPVVNGFELIERPLAPIQSQEIWASGVTYLKSKVGRQEESKKAGGGDFYAHVYEAERPELFFKALAHQTVGSGDKVKVRKDSTWNVPEPELTLFITSNAEIVGYTIGNDMSSRSIEGENPLYLPQAKSYDGSASIGPCIYVPNEPIEHNTKISLNIERDRLAVFSGEVSLSQMKRKPEELVEFLYRESSFPYGSFLMTGTGIVPPNDFTLKSGDIISISIEGIGTLVNEVA
jgi:2-dehydro-3-deoxy-D-arabinonate dehydratase